MHIIVSWDISAEGADWKQLNERMVGVFAPYSWIRPLNTFYIVKVNSEAQREAVHADLLTAARSTPHRVLFIVSPLIDGKRYEGLLPKETWPELNLRTD